MTMALDKEGITRIITDHPEGHECLRWWRRYTGQTEVKVLIPHSKYTPLQALHENVAYRKTLSI